MTYNCKLFDSKVHNVMLLYASNYPSIFNQKGYANLKHQLNIFIIKHQTCICIRVSFVSVLVLLIIFAQTYVTILTLPIE